MAVPLNQPLLGAAQFALDMSVDARLTNDPDEEQLYREYRSRLAPEADSDPPRDPGPYVGQTGGALHRAVAVEQLPDGAAEVSICLFDTPGLYVMKEDGELIAAPSTGPINLWRPRIQWTNRPAADGSTSQEPRWLLLDVGAVQYMTKEQVAGVCDPFKPEPFVQKAPSPTSSPATPTR
ncbi:hypothetical protein [Mycobacterium sp. NPDC050041]|uniref:hypothetical protein n=1 Tax=Mycobacterium sp. NPDC050041 TaxID=3364293 RepID=UPI003C2D90D8